MNTVLKVGIVFKEKLLIDLRFHIGIQNVSLKPRPHYGTTEEQRTGCEASNGRAMSPQTLPRTRYRIGSDRLGAKPTEWGVRGSQLLLCRTLVKSCYLYSTV